VAQLPTVDDLAVVEDCERALLTGAVRGDRVTASLLLHKDFREVGQSGRIWDRESILEVMEGSAEPNRLKAQELHARGLAPDVVLLTYVSSDGAGHAHRTSVWVREAGRWQLLHHQGTPAA
jgi:ribonuclease HI